MLYKNLVLYVMLLALTPRGGAPVMNIDEELKY